MPGDKTIKSSIKVNSDVLITGKISFIGQLVGSSKFHSTATKRASSGGTLAQWLDKYV